jgi:hypothetical protein
MLGFNGSLAANCEILGDMLTNSIYDNWALEMEKDTIW